jgi:hypothetical protein
MVDLFTVGWMSKQQFALAGRQGQEAPEAMRTRATLSNFLPRATYKGFKKRMQE